MRLVMLQVVCIFYIHSELEMTKFVLSKQISGVELEHIVCHNRLHYHRASAAPQLHSEVSNECKSQFIHDSCDTLMTPN